MNTTAPPMAPLADRMRPRSLDEFLGQEQLIGPDKILPRLLERGELPSLILWGPPGTGKTSLALLLARGMEAECIVLSAVLAGVPDIRAAVQQAESLRQEGRGRTILFIDEIHRFNKAQQDALLPHVERGLLTLIGATTENPSFQVIAPLLSRCQVIVLQSLTTETLGRILQRALDDEERGLGGQGLGLEDEASQILVRMADGDARRALGLLETAAGLALATTDGTPTTITAAIAAEAAQQRQLRYDADGEEHYNIISALHKSLRDSDPDGALYWLYRMLASGEDPLYIARRLVRFASEDIGNAEPQALTLALSCREAYHLLGSPEGELALAQAVVYLATAPKSNAVYAASHKVLEDIRRCGSLPVPLHLRNAPTGLMRRQGYGRGYQYAHNEENALVDQEHLPQELSGQRYYEPTNRGYEALVRDRLTKWRLLLRERRAAREQEGKNRK